METNGLLHPTQNWASATKSKRSKRERNEKGELPTSSRPLKHSFVQLHVTSDDLAIVKSSNTLKPASHRHTWPTALKGKAPGSYEFEVPPTLVRTPWEHERGRRPPSEWSRNSSDRRRMPVHKFEQLPREILWCILDQLRIVHTTGSVINAKYLQEDFRALCLSNKRWHRLAREHLYREIWAPPNGNTEQKHVVPMRRSPSQLQLLSRTLRESPALAEMVRCIRVTTNLASELEDDTVQGLLGQHRSSIERKSSAMRVFGEIISYCRNLEHFTGYSPPALDPASELFIALSACSKLKSHIWRLPSDKFDRHFDLRAADLLSRHTNWHQLETLVLWQSPDGCNLPTGTVSGMVQRFRSLKHLAVRCLHPADFHNGTLLTLPGLKSLRLEEVHGVTDQGLEQLAYSRLAFSLERLTLCGLELTSLRTIRTMFAGLSRLRRFTLLQDTAPQLEQVITSTCNTFTLASDSLRYLHWDVLAPGNDTVILAKSIASGKFPSLRKVKVPCDYDGAVQNLCRPIPLEPLTNSDIRTLKISESGDTYQRSLQVAQIQAQLRIRESRRQPAFDVVVQDEDETVQHRHVIGSYPGNMESQIEYSLDSAIEGSELAIASIDMFATAPKADLRRRTNGTEEQFLELHLLF